MLRFVGAVGKGIGSEGITRSARLDVFGVPGQSKKLLRS